MEMPMVNIKGYDFKEIIIRDSYTRRALQYKNQIINCLKKVGLTDDVDIHLESVAMRKAQASASWYMWEKHLFFSYNRSNKFVENLAMVAAVIEHFLDLLSKEEITPEEFLKLFKEDRNIIQQRKDAREVLGVEKDSTDFETMHKNYKNLSKEYRPDMPKEDTEKFKKINTAHKILKKEFD
ncbi:MAG: J domain-containing protein, partial [Candidatus Woesearchaeota archaeon]